MQLLWGIVVFSIGLVQTEDDVCDSAPNDAAKIMCMQLHQWDESARNESARKKIALPPGLLGMIGTSIIADLAPIASSIYQCMDLTCLCTYFRGVVAPNGGCSLAKGVVLKKAIRKEYRMMTDDERQRFHSAIRTLKQNGEYDSIARIHSQTGVSGGAHSGPAFLPWHREYIKRVEFALRQIDPTLFLPYWDSTLDQALQRPKDSVIFTADMAGDTDRQGIVINGPFTQWRTLEGRANIVRKVGARAQLMDQSHIDFVMKQTEVEQVMAFSAPRRGCPYRTAFNCLEYTHGNGHIFVGGDMFDTSTSANDPLFFLHHCFIDFIWEQWRQNKQTRAEREIRYPPDNQLCSSPQHFAAAGLLPFSPMTNIDGLSNKFTDNLYEYAPRPKCSAIDQNCGSNFLFCDLSHGQPRCSAKIRMGAACNGYNRQENPCYKGVCQGGICVFKQELTTTSTSPSVTNSPPTASIRPVTIAPQETCFNENECCATWASRGECSRNAGYMSGWCKASCGKCKTQYKLLDDCSDRHINCPSWIKSGECTRNPLWMKENCRKSCGKCSQTRAQACGYNEKVATTTAKPEPVCNNTDGCYNENVCCPHWGLMGECRRNFSWMACNCRVSCGHCVPIEYNYGSCIDYHQSCADWARLGECERNLWVTENCRSSCRTCYSQWELRDLCKGEAGSISPIANRSPTRTRNMWDNRNWNGDQDGEWRDYDDNWGGNQRDGPFWWGNGNGRWRSRWEGNSPVWDNFRLGKRSTRND